MSLQEVPSRLEDMANNECHWNGWLTRLRRKDMTRETEYEKHTTHRSNNQVLEGFL